MKSYQHFTATERTDIQVMLAQKKSLREIATTLGRNVASISREVKRNQNKDGSYNAWRATCNYICRRKNCKRKPRLADEEVASFVKNALDKYWSPEIISQKWRVEHPNEPLGHSTIYRALKEKQIVGYTPKTHLRRRGKRKCSHNTHTITPDHTIHERPLEIEARERLGDIEADTISGAVGKGCAVTAVDRKSRMLYGSLSKSRDSSLIEEAFGRAFDGVEVNSLTLDRGSEFARHRRIAHNHDTTVYFADPHSPWQRGSNENINGLLRFFFPKGTDFNAVTEEEFQSVVELINNRPRKCLGGLSPIDFARKCCI